MTEFWQDPLRLEDQLTEEEQLIHKTARDFCQEQLLPGIIEANRHEKFDRSIMNQLGDESLIRLPMMGGSLPLYLIDEVIGAPIVILPIANHDNNQHGKDENLRLQNLWDAIEIYAALLTHL